MADDDEPKMEEPGPEPEGEPAPAEEKTSAENSGGTPQASIKFSGGTTGQASVKSSGGISGQASVKSSGGTSGQASVKSSGGTSGRASAKSSGGTRGETFGEGYEPDEYGEYGENGELTDTTRSGFDTDEEGDEDEWMDEDLNITDSQVMIQLKEAEDEAEILTDEIGEIRAIIKQYQNQEELGDEEKEDLTEKQNLLIEKIAALDAITKRIERLLRLAAREGREPDEVTILSEEEEEEPFPDDLLPRVVICSSWDDMMPKVVVCMDMKKPGAKKLEGERDENGLTPEQREALDKERRCMAEERSKLQCRLAMMEEEMRTIMRENDILSRKMAQLKSEAETQPPFEFEMLVSAGNPTKPGEMDHEGLPYHQMGGVAGSGVEPQVRTQGLMPSMNAPLRGDQGNCHCGPRAPQLPCGGPTEIPGRSVACPSMLGNLPPVPPGPPSSAGKRCRKEFNECPCKGGMVGEMPQFSMKNPNVGMPQYAAMPQYGTMPQYSPTPQYPADDNYRGSVQPQSRQGGERAANDTNEDRSFKIAQQLQEIEMEVRRMQREISRATKDKETLKAQQATLNCAKALLM